jgi:membrane protein DedA with SNARE-associated domain/rhodanese-related sulfurtransferase
MKYLIDFFENNAPLIVFFNVLLTRGGLPLPVVPTLITAAALAGRSPAQISEIILAGLAATLAADLALYSIGHRYGWRFLGLLCQVSVSPDFCVRRTTNLYARVGPWSLLVAKFIPGLSLIAVAMAGISRISALSFVALDGVGALLFVSLSVALGLIFQNTIANVLSTLAQLGMLGNVFVLTALALYVLIKWWQRQLFIRQLRMDRITIPELRRVIDDGEEVVIVDVRPKEVRAQDGMIPGAIAGHPEDIDPIVKHYARDAEIIVYCACPNEEAAAIAAKHLKDAGFKRIRPLLGGIDAWIEAGHPIAPAPASETSSAESVGTRSTTLMADPMRPHISAAPQNRPKS